MTVTRTLLRIAVSLALVAGLLHLLDGAAIRDRLAAADLRWLLLAGVALSLQTLLMAARWRLIASRLGLSIGRIEAVGEYYLAQAVNMTLPGGILGDVGRAARTRHGAGTLSAAQAVVIERLAGQITLAAVTLAGFALSLALPGGIDWPGGTALLWLFALSLAGIGTVGLLAWPGQHRPGAIAATAAAFARALPRADWLRQGALCLVIAALNLAAFWAAARATGIALSLEAAMTLVPLVLTAMVVPLAIGGWGWREGAAAALFPLAGVAAAEGVAASVAFGLVLLAASLPGGLWPMLSRATLPGRYRQSNFSASTERNSRR